MTLRDAISEVQLNCVYSSYQLLVWNFVCKYAIIYLDYDIRLDLNVAHDLQVLQSISPKG